MNPCNDLEDVPSSLRLTILFDALDEATADTQHDLLRYIERRLLDEGPSWLGLLKTSRPDVFDACRLELVEWDALDGEEHLDDNRIDIETFLKDRFSKVEEMCDIDKEQAVQILAERCDGVFLSLPALC